MLEHIVKNGESIYDILNMYHVELEEVKATNLHITDFYNLASGMKIKVPLIHNEVEQILENTESFVQKYYPKVHELYENDVEQVPVREQKVEEVRPVIEQPIPPIPKQMKGRPYPGIVPPTSPYKK